MNQPVVEVVVNVVGLNHWNAGPVARLAAEC